MREETFMQAIRSHFKHRFAEWIVGIALLLWGTIVLFSAGLFESTDIFQNMQKLASQEFWGFVAMFVGGLRIVFLVINGTWRRSAHLRAIGSGLSACIWGAIWSSYATLDNVVPNLATIGALLALDIYSLWFAAADAKHSDLRTKEDKQIVREVRKRVS